MLKGTILHPELLSGLASAGHLGQILIGDGNYPHNTAPNPSAKIVWANFTPGILDAGTVLRLVCHAVPIEAAAVMAPAKSGHYAMKSDPPIWAKFRQILREHAGFDDDFIKLQKPKFNELARNEKTCLVIATAETEIYANILLTIGVVR